MSISFRSSTLNMLVSTRRLGILIFVLMLLLEQSHAYMTTIITFEYFTSQTNYLNKTQDSRTNGILSTRGSQAMVRRRSAVVLTDVNGYFDGCQDSINANNVNNSIAIIQRGGNCTFSVKITRAKQYGAAAVIIYDPLNPSQDLFNMLHNNSDMVAVYVHRTIGDHLLDLARNNRTYLNITLKPIRFDYDEYPPENIWFGSQSATIFIAVSICILLCLCISWLIFYYCQRHRSRTAKDRLQNRLSNAAKKALTKIPLVNVNETPTNEESCVICLDGIQTGDTVRQLVCGHTFHHHCVDPWLLNHRHCPLCNLDILAAYRVSVPSSSQHRRRSSTNGTTNHPRTPLPTSQTVLIHQTESTRNRDHLPTISATIKDDTYNVSIHGEQNPTFRSD